MIDPLTLIVLILAIMRLTRGVAWDRITLGFRKLVMTGFAVKVRGRRVLWWKGSGTTGQLSYLVHCVFCVSFWASIAVVIPYSLYPQNKWLFTCYLILAVAEVAPRLLNWEPRSRPGGE